MRESCWRPMSVCMIFNMIAALFVANSAVAVVIPTDASYDASGLSAPAPGVFMWNSSIGHYGGKLIYAGDNRRIYAFDLDTESSDLVCDTSGLSDPWASVSGFLVSTDNYLYFHANTFPTVMIYRVLLTDPWPANYEVLDTGCNGSIFSLTQNPWTDVIWFASADLGQGMMYLYEVNSALDTVTKRAAFASSHGGGNGPIIFKEPSTLLYGESVWGGDGYFHVVDSTAGMVIEEDYITFSGGLAGASYGYDDMIYVTTGSGKKIYKIRGSDKIQVATTEEEAQGVVFDGSSLYISEQKSSDFSGSISFFKLWRSIVPLGADGNVNPTSINPGGGASGCFISTASPDITKIGACFLVLLWVGMICSCLAFRRFSTGTAGRASDGIDEGNPWFE